ncbi:MAG TPA: T9SS type A sorting domain-containing protein [Bacteroidales bacterium]|nr:T9SS type A sorting domain-containing protein [Bacteroidales bacterium]
MHRRCGRMVRHFSGLLTSSVLNTYNQVKIGETHDFMKVTVLFVLLLALSITWQANAQENILYGIIRYFDSQQAFLIKINPESGEVIELSGSPIGEGASGNSVIDPIHNLLFFSEGYSLITVDLNSGNVLYDVQNPNPNSQVSLFAFNCKDSTLYGIIRYFDTQDDYLIKIIPSTGEIIQISGMPVGNRTASNSALDPINNRLFFYDKYSLITVDLNTGESIYEVPNPIANSSISVLAFNIGDTTLYGIVRYLDTQNDYLAKIIPETGELIVLSDEAIGYKILSNSAIDPLNNRLYFYDQTSFIAVDLISGNRLYSVEYTIADSQISTLSYNTGCPAVITGNNNYKSNPHCIFPNPSYGEFYIDSDQRFSEFSLYDISGRLILKKVIPGGGLHIKGMNAGLYLYRLSSVNHQISVCGKLVVR